MPAQVLAKEQKWGNSLLMQGADAHAELGVAHPHPFLLLQSLLDGAKDEQLA